MPFNIFIGNCFSKFYEAFSNEKAEINMVAIVLIILVVIALIAIFKEQLTNLLNTLFQKIEEEAIKI